MTIVKEIVSEFMVWKSKGMWSKHENRADGNGLIETEKWYNTYRYEAMKNPLTLEELFNLFLEESK